MRIVIIGTGNVATVLGKKFLQAGHSILQVYGRNADGARDLAAQLQSSHTGQTDAIDTSADFYLLAVDDDAIEVLASRLQLPEKLVAHTAAAVQADVLKLVSDNYGVLYPLQSLRKEMDIIPEMPVLYQGSNEWAKRQLAGLADTLSGGLAAEMNDESRLRLHVAAVMVNNFVNHLFVLAEDYCSKEGLEFTLLRPLIEETARRAFLLSPSACQTGPAKRNDQSTIDRHLSILDQHPGLKPIYELLTKSIRRQL